MKYYGTKNNIDFGFYNEPFDKSIEISDEQWKILQTEQSLGKTIVSDNNSVFSTDTPDRFFINNSGLWQQKTEEEYALELAEKEKQETISNIKKQIEDLDIKRIRAICEPEIKDEATGQTWLDFYNTQIIELRNQLIELEGTKDENENM